MSSVAKEIVEYLKSNNQEVAKEDVKKSDLEEINFVLKDYIVGTANGEPDRVRNAFHEDFNLYFIKSDSLEVWEGKGYVDKIEVGKKKTR